MRVGGAPHGLNLSHAQVFNDALLAFLRSWQGRAARGAPGG
jgi:hypothetical protein